MSLARPPEEARTAGAAEGTQVSAGDAPAPGFDAAWLALREPFDRQARAPADAALAALPRASGQLQVLDLGCGTGASLRALAPRLGGAQRWRLVDHDAALLAAVPRALQAWAEAQGWHWQAQGGEWLLQGPGLRVEIVCQQADLATALTALALPQDGLVTASALLDLVSEDWVAALVAQCRAARAQVCWALSVDGRVAFEPVDAADAAVLALFCAHQRRDKGLGPALGAQAPARAQALLVAAGYRVGLQRSDWQLEAASHPNEAALVRAMVEGLAGAALEQAPAQAATVQAWRARRLAGLAATRLRVGHADLLGWL
jgi:SAM-dependent methyltransferase